MTTSIEQLFADLCAKHDLTTVCLEYHHGDGFAAYAHWEANGWTKCVCGGGDTVADALADAMAAVAARRAKDGAQ